MKLHIHCPKLSFNIPVPSFVIWRWLAVLASEQPLSSGPLTELLSNGGPGLPKLILPGKKAG